MRTPLAVLAACCLAALAGGCGSSGATSTGASGSTANATRPATASTSTSTSTSTRKRSPEELKVDTTPKFGSPAASAPVRSGLVQIAYRNITIQPDTVKVKVGSTVRWTNYDSVQANVTSVSGPQRFASKNFGEGGTFAVKLEKPGVIHYECTLYPTTMNGTIEVVA